jgi:hypothetical protein
MNATANFIMTTEEMRTGFLSFLGVGVTEDKTVTTTTSHSSSREVSVGETITTSVNFTALGLERYAIQGYYDLAFGTFAFKTVPQNPTPSISGRALDKDGRPAARQLVTLKMGNTTFKTRADDQGRYAFHSATIKPGRGMLMLGTQARKDLEFRGTPLRNEDLRLRQ